MRFFKSKTLLVGIALVGIPKFVLAELKSIPEDYYGPFEIDKNQQELGSGVRGFVVTGTMTDDGEKVAIKTFNNKDVGEKEALLLHNIDHHRIPKLKGFTDAETFKIAMELIDGDPLSKLLWGRHATERNSLMVLHVHSAPHGPLQAEKVPQLIADLLSAIHYLHINGIGHFDGKPNNIVISKDLSRAYLIDLSEARLEENDPADFAYTILVDHYNLAGIIEFSLTGRLPKEFSVDSIGVVGVRVPNTGNLDANDLIVQLTDFRDTKKAEDFVKDYENFRRHPFFVKASVAWENGEVIPMGQMLSISYPHQQRMIAWSVVFSLVLSVVAIFGIVIKRNRSMIAANSL